MLSKRAWRLFALQNETTPLLLPIGGKHRSLSRGAVHELMKTTVEQTTDKLRQRGTESASKEDRLIQASAH